LALVVDAVGAELERLKQTDSALAASALALAAAVDAPDSTTSLAMCARELRETLATLRALAASKHEPDRIDDLAARRKVRVAG
jgi:hypothetical protein